MGEPAAVPHAWPIHVEPVEAPPGAGRSAGIIISAVLHFCAVIGLSLILGPVHLGPDEPLKLDVAVAPSEAVPAVFELDASHEEGLTTLNVDRVSALPHHAARGAFSSLGVLDGGGAGHRGTFFGTVAYGNRFVYVLDVSSSMNRMRDPAYDLSRFDCAVDELLRSVGELTEDQYFYVVLFSYGTRPMFDEESLLPQPIPATAENKERLKEWLAGVRPGSGTDPRVALSMALRMHPSAVFLLSDGEFNGQQRRNNADVLHGNPSVEEVVTQHNRMGTPINTIAYEDRRTRRRMAALAAESGGEHRYVPPLNQAGSK